MLYATFPKPTKVFDMQFYCTKQGLGGEILHVSFFFMHKYLINILATRVLKYQTWPNAYRVAEKNKKTKLADFSCLTHSQ